VTPSRDERDKPSIAQKVGAEFVGTFFVTVVAASVDVLYFSGSGHVDYVSRWLARGCFAGPISGASMNPARSIPPLILGGAGSIAWIYAVGPSVGAVLAAIVAGMFFNRPNKGERSAAKGR